MVLLSKVAKTRATRTKLPGIRTISLGLVFSFLPLSSAFAASDISVKSLNDCNWFVTYRGRTYDLAPLTREALSRPIDDDIRYALQRVPEAGMHLTSMDQNLKDARAHTMLGSAFATGFLLSRVLKAGEKNPAKFDDYNVASIATAAFFVAATLFSWRATSNAKSELVQAVEAFNEKSPDKVEPARVDIYDTSDRAR